MISSSSAPATLRAGTLKPAAVATTRSLTPPYLMPFVKCLIVAYCLWTPYQTQALPEGPVVSTTDYDMSQGETLHLTYNGSFELLIWYKGGASEFRTTLAVVTNDGKTHHFYHHNLNFSVDTSGSLTLFQLTPDASDLYELEVLDKNFYSTRFRHRVWVYSILPTLEMDSVVLNSSERECVVKVSCRFSRSTSDGNYFSLVHGNLSFNASEAMFRYAYDFDKIVTCFSSNGKSSREAELDLELICQKSPPAKQHSAKDTAAVALTTCAAAFSLLVIFSYFCCNLENARENRRRQRLAEANLNRPRRGSLGHLVVLTVITVFASPALAETPNKMPLQQEYVLSVLCFVLLFHVKKPTTVFWLLAATTVASSHGMEMSVTYLDAHEGDRLEISPAHFMKPYNYTYERAQWYRYPKTSREGFVYGIFTPTEVVATFTAKPDRVNFFKNLSLIISPVTLEDYGLYVLQCDLNERFQLSVYYNVTVVPKIPWFDFNVTKVESTPHWCRVFLTCGTNLSHFFSSTIFYGSQTFHDRSAIIFQNKSYADGEIICVVSTIFESTYKATNINDLCEDAAPLRPQQRDQSWLALAIIGPLCVTICLIALIKIFCPGCGYKWPLYALIVNKGADAALLNMTTAGTVQAIPSYVTTLLIFIAVLGGIGLVFGILKFVFLCVIKCAERRQ